MIQFDKFASIDASMGAFMDDMFKCQLIPRSGVTAKGVARLSQQSDFRLDRALVARYYSQNRSKQDVVPALRGRQLTRATIDVRIASGCCGGCQLKHLGAWLNAANSNANEIQA
eukprot:2576698-Pyramimonas_sp.AAC.1